ncbi:MAG: class I SAM-dependent methyltransferase [Alphaproteobacteria bacterium]
MQQTLATEWSPQAYVTSTKGNWKRWLQTRPYRILLRRFGSANTASVTCADIGAADGANGAMLLRAGLIGAYHALELDEDLRKVAATRGLTASSFDAEHDEIPGQFDVVLCLHVCEHVRSPDFFDRLARGVKPGGVLIAATQISAGSANHSCKKPGSASAIPRTSI